MPSSNCSCNFKYRDSLFCKGFYIPLSQDLQHNDSAEKNLMQQKLDNKRALKSAQTVGRAICRKLAAFLHADKNTGLKINRGFKKCRCTAL